MRTFPMPAVPFRESEIRQVAEKLKAALRAQPQSEVAPRPYHVSESRNNRAQARQFACSHNCGHPACSQGCTLYARRRAFLDGDGASVDAKREQSMSEVEKTIVDLTSLLSR